ncbi:hypothetical protein V6N13_146295 [Hibiscus sabdariffa]
MPRTLPQGMSRAFIGRMLADPAFLYMLLLEEVATIGSSVWWEVDRIKQEWDLALMNVLTVAACNALALCRSYGNTFQFDLQNTLQKDCWSSARVFVKFLASKKKEKLSVTTNALGYGAFLGLYANLRYQLLCGFDQAVPVVNHFDVIGVAFFSSTALRVLNVQQGERSRLAWLGVEVDRMTS